MALLFIDGCDLHATGEDLTRRWTPSGTLSFYISVHATDGRFGGGVIKLSGTNPSHITRIARLALLAPGIIEAILAGTLNQGVILDRLEKGVPVDWEEQRTTCSD